MRFTRITESRFFYPIVLLLIFFVSILLRACFLDSILYHTYGDAELYVDMARSFASTGRFEFAGLPTGASAYPLYAFVLSFIFHFYDSNTVLYISKIVGIVLMSSAVFPIYFSAKELNISKPTGCFVSFLTVLIPEMFYGLHFSLEVVLFPMFLWLTFFIIRDVENISFNRKTVPVIIFLVLCSLSKNIGFIIFVSFCAYLTVTLFTMVANKEDHKLRYLLKIATTIITYFVVYIILLYLLNINKVDTLSDNEYGVFDLILGFVTYFLSNPSLVLLNALAGVMKYMFCILMAFGVFIPIISFTYKHENMKDKQLLYFLLCLVVFSVLSVVTVIHIGVENVFNSTMTRVHYRYLFHIYPITLLLFFKCDFSRYTFDKFAISIVSFIVLYIITSSSLFDIRDVVRYDSLSLSVFGFLDVFVRNNPSIRQTITFVILIFLSIPILLLTNSSIKVKKISKYAIMFIAVSLIALNNIHNIKVWGTISDVQRFKDEDIPLLEAIEPYYGGEIIYLVSPMPGAPAVAMGPDWTLYTKKVLAKIIRDTVLEYIDKNTGICNFSEIPKKRYHYNDIQATDDQLIGNATCLVLQKNDGYTISDREKVIFESDKYLVIELSNNSVQFDGLYMFSNVMVDGWIDLEKTTLEIYPAKSNNLKDTFEIAFTSLGRAGYGKPKFPIVFTDTTGAETSLLFDKDETQVFQFEVNRADTNRPYSISIRGISDDYFTPYPRSEDRRSLYVRLAAYKIGDYEVTLPWISGDFDWTQK